MGVPNRVSDLVAAVRKMRTAQQAYFRTRNATKLREARWAEQEVDEILRTQFPPIQPMSRPLFDESAEPSPGP